MIVIFGLFELSRGRQPGWSVYCQDSAWRWVARDECVPCLEDFVLPDKVALFQDTYVAAIALGLSVVARGPHSSIPVQLQFVEHP